MILNLCTEKGPMIFHYCFYQSLVWALRRAGCNPTEQEMMDFINNVDDGTGNLNFESYCNVLRELHKETDAEAVFKNAFRAFSKDNEGI